MNPTFSPIAGEYRRALRVAAAECDVATLYRIALALAAAYEATAEPAEAEPITRSPYLDAGRVAGGRARS